VHDWLTGVRGGERVLEAVAEIFPRSDLFTLLYIPGKLPPTITTLKRHVSWLQKVPGAEKRYRSFLPLMPSMIESFDLTGFDLIVSTSHCVAKGIRKPPGSVHVSYVFAPMRYMWDRFDEYFGQGRAGPHVRLAAKAFRSRLRHWDREVSQAPNVDRILTLSHYIREQIQSAYSRDSSVIYPFVDSARFSSKPRRPGRNYLMVGAFAPYKRVDLAIEAFNRLKLPLLVVGSGQSEAKLKKMAGPTVELLGSLSDHTIDDLYSRCRAFVFPGEEDFGITPLEASAAGAPVIAYGSGGALETVTEKTGIFFKPQTVEALMEAVMKLERGEVSFSEADCRARAAEFSRERFQKELIAAIREAWRDAGRDPGGLDERLRSSWAPAIAEAAQNA
jgi:glycosyltransferase involved in cell wall biosynthesis